MYIQATLDCTLYLMQYPYDPGISPSSANYCILGKVYLRFNLLTESNNLTRKYPGMFFLSKLFRANLPHATKLTTALHFLAHNHRWTTPHEQF